MTPTTTATHTSWGWPRCRCHRSLRCSGQTGQVTRRRLGLHLARNLCHFAGQNLWFFAVAAIPIAQVFALEFTSPLWVIVLSPFVLGEKLTPTRALAAVLGFVGILVVARPSPETINPFAR